MKYKVFLNVILKSQYYSDSVLLLYDNNSMKIIDRSYIKARVL